MALPDPEQVLQQYRQLNKELRGIEEEFNRREQHELAALEEARRIIEVDWRKEREAMISELPAQMPLPKTLEELMASKRDGLLALKDETYQREKAERQNQLEEDKRKLTHEWSMVLPPGISALSLSEPPSQVVEASPQALDFAPCVLEAPPPVTEAPGRPAAPTPLSHESAGLQAPAPMPNASFRPQNTMIQPQNAPYPASNGPFQVPLASMQFPSPSYHVPHVSSGPLQLPTPPTVPSQPIPPPAQHRKPLPTGPQQPPTRFQQQPPGPQFPPGAFPSGRDAAHFHTGPVTVERPPPQQQHGQVLPRILPGGEVSGRDSESGGPVPASASLSGMAPQDVAPPPKRRAEDAPRPTESQPKRVRMEDAGNGEGAENEQSSDRQRTASQKTITFDEVFGDGHAKFKHHIVEYPSHSGAFYILKCEQHGVHFNANPLAGAAKHLHSAQHGNMSKERAQAVELLGYQVVDCTAELANANNALFQKLLDAKEYIPLNMNQASKSARRSMGFSADPQPTPPKVASGSPLAPLAPRRSHRGAFRGITNPDAGEMYLAYWKKDKKHYIVIILPWGNLELAGMMGSLSSTGLLQRAPKCYDIDETTGQIRGWNPEVDETKREFPVLYFDGRTSIGWVRAKDLSPFDFNTRSWRDIPYFKEATDHYARARGYISYEDMVNSRSGAPPSRPPGHIGVTTISKPAAPPVEDHDMVDNSTAQVADDSDADSASKGMMSDSDSDVEMANTESRRTSVSNRGDTQDQTEKPASVGHGAYQSQAPGQETPSNAGQISNRPSPQPQEARRGSMGYGAGGVMTLAQTAQLIMSKTSPASGSSSLADSRIGRQKGGSEHPSRRVEKIYAHNNPNRSSNSPRVHSAAVPERRGDAAAQQSVAPAQQTHHVPSPASLQNILHGQPNEQSYHPAPSRQPAYLGEPQDPRRGPSPLQHPLTSTEPPPAHGLEAPTPVAKARIPSPLQMPSRLVSQLGQSSVAEQQLARSRQSSVPGPVSNPESRGSTPVIVRIDPSAPATQDRWRAVRSEQASTATSGSEPPPNPQPVLNPLPTPNPSSAGTQPGSPNLLAKPSPTFSVKRPSNIDINGERGGGSGSATKEVFDVGLLGVPEDLERLNIKETVRLMTDPSTQTARTSSESTTTVIIDPSQIDNIVVHNEGAASARVVKLVYVNGQRGTLVFGASDVGLGLQNGRVHARRFCRWVTSVNPSVEYSNAR
ncbi:hypothetical protein B0T16DRAFT_392578 [Cercophora newfieldiana]|uniref:Uncharacterized protein n=1 Tax=Cercophora newfieldiana TaxID=92897 RepID=A0AA40CMT0_9PEZI|nr:hypothetical protein B0T16DRAFT_392578 [Cercophora newfieldiana]